MQVHFQRDGEGRLVGIARKAGFLEWVASLARREPRPQPVPHHLRADLGLPPADIVRLWPLTARDRSPLAPGLRRNG